jgi:hypothetical protein
MSATPPPPDRTKPNTSSRRTALILLILVWTFAYNILVKQQSPGRAFFGMLDTISDDFVMGTLVAVTLGVLILAVFSVTKLYTQLIANVYAFHILEDIVFSDVAGRRWRRAATRLITLEDQPVPRRSCPERVSFLLFCCGLIYAMSWIYVVLFAEALFFVSWSSGVDLPVNDRNVLMLPILSLALPFSARVMAYLRYPYAQTYADFMPAALFVLLIVAALGYQFGSPDQEFFLLRVYRDEKLLTAFVANGVFLAFIPVFFEAVFWLFELGRVDEEARDSEAPAAAASTTPEHGSQAGPSEG